MTYTTTFSSAQNPLSESGNWVNGQTLGLDWNNCLIVTPGRAQGQMVVTSGYCDPTSILTGSWGPNQTAQATVYIGTPNASYYQEVELRLRSTISAHVNNGYEINFSALGSAGSYMQIVRWNGPISSYTYVSSYSGTQYAVSNGDVVKAFMVGDSINVYKNNIWIGYGKDATYTTGSPGIGFDYGCDGTYANFCFTNFTATDGVGGAGKYGNYFERRRK
jgi:hypothetical protein